MKNVNKKLHIRGKFHKMGLILTKLRIQNFKSFNEEQEIDFNKITLLTGANSSGKSTIIQAILSALQSKDFPFLYSTNGKYANLGDFREISNRHNKINAIKIGFTFKDTGDGELILIDTIWEENKKNKLAQLKSLKFERQSGSLNITKFKNYYKFGFKYDPNKDIESNPLYRELVDLQIEQISQSTNKIKEIQNKTKQNSNKAQKVSLSKKEINEFKKLLYSQYKKFEVTNIKINSLANIEEEFKKYPNLQLRRTLDVLNGIFQNFNSTANFISSFRLHPDRTYLEKSIETLKVGTFGQGYLDQLVLWEATNHEKVGELVKIMSSLNLSYKIKSKRIGGGRYEMQLTTNKNGVLSPISDVGFGISQFMPIIIADLQLPQNSTLFVSQPEIHLHPSAQAQFANYLQEQVGSHNKRYVLETHSEYLITRIRLLIVEGKLKPEDVSLYYLENSKSAKLYSIKFTKEGEIIGAPSGFFDTYLMDLKNLAIKSL